MIKAITKLKEDPKMYNEVVSRIIVIPDSGNWFCRYSFGEFQKAAYFISEYEMRFTPEQHNSFMSRFNECETNILQQLLKSSGEDVLKRVESRVKVCTQKTQRFIESIVEDVEHENEIYRMVEEAKSNRTKTKSSLETDYQKLKSIFE